MKSQPISWCKVKEVSSKEQLDFSSSTEVKEVELEASMTEIKRTVKLTTQQAVIEGAKPVAEGFPMREWSIRINLVNDKGEEVPAEIFDKVTYKLHPTFQNPNRTIKKLPFKLEEEGWGEFDMEIVLHAVDKGGDHTIRHDLNFQEAKYETLHVMSFTNPKPNLARLLAKSGPVPGLENLPEENGAPTPASTKKDKRKGHDDDTRANKKGRSSVKNVDMEKLAEGLQKLEEDDLLKVVQLVHEHKTQDTYIKNDVEQGEFHMDLYTLPDNLVKLLWQLMTSKVDV